MVGRRSIRVGFTQEQLDALREAYASGATSVRWGNESVTYGSREDIRRRIEEIEAELGVTQRGSRRRILRFDNGLR